MNTPGHVSESTADGSGLRLGALLLGVRIGGLGTAVIGGAALLGWMLGWPLLASLSTSSIQMAPSTAVLLLLAGAAVGYRAWAPSSMRAYRIGQTLGGLIVGVALLLITLGCLHLHWSVEHLGLNIVHTAGEAPRGHMSPLTACFFLLAGVSFLAALSPASIPAWRATLALGAAGLLLGPSLLFLLAYLYGAPLFYGGAFIPPAFNTLMAFTTLGLALLALAGRAAGLSRPEPAVEGSIFVRFALLFLLLAVGLISAGYVAVQNFARQYRDTAEHQLASIADLKVSELVQWRRERLGDGNLFFRNPNFAALVQRFLAQPEEAEAQRPLQDWLGKIQVYYNYDQVRLLDPQGRPLLSLPADQHPLSATVLQRLPEVLRAGQVAFQDFYRDEHDRRIYLAVLVPLFDAVQTNRPLGLLKLRIDPEHYLYPFIQRWPTPSPSAETLLVRREGPEAVFLNKLRFQTDAALNFRAPLDQFRLPAAQAALGHECIMDGVDYRGAAVLAAIRMIPGSPWGLVARVDTAEVYAPLRERLWQVVAMLGALLLAAGLGVGLLWRQQHVRLYQDRAAVAEELRASELRYRRLFEAARDGVLILDAGTGMVVDVNPFLIELLGLSREHFLGKKVWELGFFKDALANEDNFRALQQKGYVRYEDMALEDADGQRHEVEFVSNVYLVNQQKVIQCNIRDISERKRAEAVQRESEQRYRDLFDNMLNGFAYCRMIFEQDQPRDLVYLATNDAFEKLTGLQHVVGRKISEVIPGIRESDPELIARYGRVARTGVPERFEFYTEALKMWLDLTLYSPAPDHFVAVFDVITARKQVEAALREQGDFLRVSNNELTRLNRLVTGRELRLIELKQQVNELAAQLGQPRPYALAFMDAAAANLLRSQAQPGEPGSGTAPL